MISDRRYGSKSSSRAVTRSKQGTMKITKPVGPAFANFLFDWNYETYLLVGGYGSGKSYHVALKIIFKLLSEKRKCLVVREVAATHNDSTFSLFKEILEDMHLLTEDRNKFSPKNNKVYAKKSPMSILFPNGSEIIFKGMDNPEKIKSINGISIVWLEEASEVKFAGYEELLGRLRTPNVSMHFFLTTNPVSTSNWIYTHFFVALNNDGTQRVIVDPVEFYNKKCLVHDGIYYHHSLPSDNPWLPIRYLARLDGIRNYDPPLYKVARWGEFGVSGTKVLPQFRVIHHGMIENRTMEHIRSLGYRNMYIGFDFGFEESFNAVVFMSVDQEKQTLYIWDEIYMNHVTDDKFAELPEMLRLKELQKRARESGNPVPIIADNEDPKAITYYRQKGFEIRACRNKFAGSRLSNTRKVKRFQRILCHRRCVNVIRELSDLTYAKAKNGDMIPDQFNIDPHSFSAIWYALDTVTVADLKDREYYSKKGQWA